MNRKVIILVCSGGMSTSLLAIKMIQVAEEKKVHVDIFAVPMSDAVEFANEKNGDILLVAPQIRYMLTVFKKKLSTKAIPITVIPMRDYGLMDGKKVLDFAEELIRSNNELKNRTLK